MTEWSLHRQPKDQIVDHEYSIWFGDNPVVLANVMPGEEGVLATIVATLNEVEATKPRQDRIDALVKALRTVRDYIKNCDHDPAVDAIDAVLALVEGGRNG